MVGEMVKTDVVSAGASLRRVADKSCVDICAVYPTRIAHHVRQRESQEARATAKIKNAVSGFDRRGSELFELRIAPLKHTFIALDAILFDVDPVIGEVGINIHLSRARLCCSWHRRDTTNTVDAGLPKHHNG